MFFGACRLALLAGPAKILPLPSAMRYPSPSRGVRFLLHARRLVRAAALSSQRVDRRLEPLRELSLVRVQRLVAPARRLHARDLELGVDPRQEGRRVLFK